VGDGGRWIKLWCSALTDPHLEALSDADWRRWIVLLLYIKTHGTGGTLVVPYPARTLLESLYRGNEQGRSRVDRYGPASVWRDFVSFLARIPNCGVSCDGEIPSQTLTVVMRNWAKYQANPSAERTRRYRERRGSVSTSPHRHALPSADPAQQGSVVPSQGGNVTLRDKDKDKDPHSPIVDNSTDGRNDDRNGTPRSLADLISAPPSRPTQRPGHFDDCACPACSRAHQREHREHPASSSQQAPPF